MCEERRRRGHVALQPDLAPADTGTVGRAQLAQVLGLALLLGAAGCRSSDSHALAASGAPSAAQTGRPIEVLTWWGPLGQSDPVHALVTEHAKQFPDDYVISAKTLLSGRARGFKPLVPARLSESAPLKIVVPGPDNTRRRNLETYFQTNGVEIAAMLEMDAMIGTLEFVARSDWVTVLPSLISVNDLATGDIIVNPLADPPMHAEFVLIQPARRTLTAQARLFLERFEAEVAHIHAVWDAAIASGPLGGAKRKPRMVKA